MQNGKFKDAGVDYQAIDIYQRFINFVHTPILMMMMMMMKMTTVVIIDDDDDLRQAECS